MKFRSKPLIAALLCSVAALTGRAQNQPVMTVSLTEVAVLSGVGEVAFLDITNVGTAYQFAPTVTFTGGGAPTTTALAKSSISLTGTIANINITDPGAGYTSRPTVVIGPPTGTNGITAEATAYVGTRFRVPTQNESYGPVGTSIAMTGLAVGTFPAGGYTYEFFVNGISVGVAVAHPPAGTPAAIGWEPPQPGSYFLTVKASDGIGHEATSLPARYFAVGTMITSPATNTIVPNGSSVVIQATATPQPLTGGNVNNAFVQRIEFYADGALIGSDNTAPYSIIYTPSIPPTPNVPTNRHTIEARAFDNNGNQISVNGTAVQNLTMVPPIGTPPTVILSSPTTGSKIAIPSGGASIPIAVSAGSPNGLIQKVELYIDGLLFSTSSTFPYSFNWTPTVVGDYRLVALGYDDKNNVVATSTSAVGTLTPAPTLITIAAPPTITLISPAPGSSVGVNTPINIIAAATDSNVVGGGVNKVQFFANNAFIGEDTTPDPGTNKYSLSFTPLIPGSVDITATALNNLGISTTSEKLTVAVNGGGGGGGGTPVGIPPVVALTSPRDGSVIRINSATTLSATATDPDGTIASVQFQVNGVATGSTVTAFPYSTTWTPVAEGVYRVTATATDNTGSSTTSTAATVLVVTTTAAGDSVYSGIIVGATENGTFTAINAGGRTAAFIGTSTANGVSKTYFFSGMPVGGSGAFSGSGGGHTITGTFSDTGAFGTLDGNVSFSGAITLPPAVPVVAAGYYTGNIAGRLASSLNAIIGPDGAIALYIVDGTFQAAGFGAVDSNGNFTNIPLLNTNARISGRADPVTGFLTGTITGGPGGTIMAATSAGASFSDGTLRNLSTRGNVGTGANILIAGFYVAGSAPKRIMVRAIGPSLAGYGVTGVIADPQLLVMNASNVVIAQNDNWAAPIGTGAATSSQISDAAVSVGAFAIDPLSRDAVAIVTLSPGLYSVQVSGVGGGTGIALVELYDIDSPTPFSAQKLINVSTRGNVGTNQSQLIAGFVISGNTPKKVMIRGAGPTLAAPPINLGGSLADPVLQLYRRVNGVDILVRENDNWAVGNDATQVADAATRIGAFALLPNSKDAVILINLPPGLYSAVFSGSGGTTGLGLVEVYEIP